MYQKSENDVLVARFTAYLVKVAKHASFDYFRQKRRYYSNISGFAATEEASVEFDQLYDQMRSPQTEFEFDNPKIQHAYQKLNLQRQMILKYTFLYGFSEEEIAALTGQKKEYIRVIRFRALNSMRKMLGLEGQL